FDKIITAGHCHTPEEALTSSVTFDYVTDKDGLRPASYNPKFFKVTAVFFPPNDGIGGFTLLQLAGAAPRVPSSPHRPRPPGVGESVFALHHPNGAVKKVSPLASDAFVHVSSSSSGAIVVPTLVNVSGGSSGSGLFDLAGRIVGVLSNGAHCGSLSYFPTASI